MNIFVVTGICVVMAVASYAVGIAPTRLSMSAMQNRAVSGFSMGILIGAAFCLALPEGIEGILSDSVDSDSPGRSIEDLLDHLPLLVGVPLTLGFVVMFVVDYLPHFLGSEVAVHQEPINWKQWVASVIRSSLTITLVIHSLVDGISLGSAFKKGDISYIFAIVIIIHKLPTAFSLGSLLLEEKVPASVVSVHVGVFAATTPITAMLTWFLFLVMEADKFFIGLMVLFSTGNFVYVVCHIMPSVLKDTALEDSRPTITQLGLTLGGIIVTILLSFTHH